MRFRMFFAVAALVTSFGCGSSNSPAAPTTGNGGGSGGSGTAVSIVNGARTLTNTAYAPNPVNISAGGSVTWTNNDSTTHTSTADDNSWSSGSVAPGASFTRTFASAGKFTYHCTIHPGMVGTVVVQ